MAPSHQFLKCVLLFFSGFGKPCSYSLYRIFIVFWWFSSRDKTLPDTFKCSPIKWNCRHHYHNHHYHITTTTITHHCHHLYHNHQHHNDNHHNHHNWWMLIFTSSTSGFWRKSRKKASFSHLQLSHILGKSRTKASFSHLQLSVFEGSLSRKLLFHILHFQFQQLIPEKSEPCHVLRLLATHLRWATCGKKNSFSASNGPASGR